jgi:DNA gyrase subunit A
MSSSQLDLFCKPDRLANGQPLAETSTMGTKPRSGTSAPKRVRKPASPPGGAPPAPPRPPGDSSGGGGDLDASLQEETRRRYLNYALSVITSRALPDVRDGLKPVQRRILYAMWNDEHLYPDAKHRKSAKVVGSVIGRYHPHGDTAVYDALVRMAQDFALRVPLVDGSGNFGSLDGDPPAAYRYTECRLTPPAMELLRELKQDTVHFHPNYDNTTTEPTVLPARFPNLLVNGSTGIAVGMATNIPPHNLSEVTDALVALLHDRSLTTTNLLKHIKGPDFPTGGQILNSKVELRQIYDTGQGAIRVRAEYETEPHPRTGPVIIITSIPYAIDKSTVIERIAEVIVARRLPQVLDVRDESTDDVRIVLETKRDTDPAMVMAYLYKHTPLQLNFNMNLTCLVPTDNPAVGRPARLGIKALLEHYLDFRHETLRRRFEHDLAALRERLHILRGFVKVFGALDEAIAIIRKSDSKRAAAAALGERFKLDEVQVEAILELKLYKLARLEIDAIRAELGDKTAEAERIEGILGSKSKMWRVVESELVEVAEHLRTPRRTKVGSADEEPEFDADAYIVDEDAHVVVTRDGWIKRLREVKDLTKLRLREGDAALAILPGSTKEAVVFFTNMGSAYVIKINDVPATTGYGDPAQKLFKFKDKERIISALTLDGRAVVPETMLAISQKGFGLRFALAPYREVTTRAGRQYARPGEGNEIVAVVPAAPTDTVLVATAGGHVLQCAAEEINQLEGPGKGVKVIKVASDDAVIAALAASHRSQTLQVETVKSGTKYAIAPDPKKVVARGGRGYPIVKRSQLRPTPVVPEVIVLATTDSGEGAS